MSSQLQVVKDLDDLNTVGLEVEANTMTSVVRIVGEQGTVGEQGIVV